MKCPFCGHDSETQVCDKCSALIPAEKPTDKEEKHLVNSRKRKEMNKYGT